MVRGWLWLVVVVVVVGCGWFFLYQTTRNCSTSSSPPTRNYSTSSASKSNSLLLGCTDGRNRICSNHSPMHARHPFVPRFVCMHFLHFCPASRASSRVACTGSTCSARTSADLARALAFAFALASFLRDSLAISSSLAGLAPLTLAMNLFNLAVCAAMLGGGDLPSLRDSRSDCSRNLVAHKPHSQ